MKRIVMHWKIRVWWAKLWVRQDELHKSLDIDTKAVLKMNQEQRVEYFNDLRRRRDIAHKRTIEKNKKSFKKFAVWMKKQFETEMKKRGLNPTER
jgi:hypothetical protein